MNGIPNFNNLKELVEFIETEAVKRAEEILEKGEYDFDRIILNIIKNSSKPVSSIEIATLTGLPQHRVCKKLRKLSNFDTISCSTTKKVRFWKLKDTNFKPDSERPKLPDEFDRRKGGEGPQSRGKVVKSGGNGDGG
jgi:predicted transcriptional regulator